MDAFSVLTLAVVESNVVIEPVSETKSKVSICPSTCKSLVTLAFIESENEAFMVDPLNIKVSILFPKPRQSIFPLENNGPS